MGSRDSVFYSSIRALCVSFFAIIGVAVGLFVVLIILTSVLSSGGEKADVVGHYAVLPDANGHVAPLARHTPLILHVDIAGPIGNEELSAQTIRDQLQRSQQGPLAGRIQGVIVHINSPGGSAFDSAGIYTAIDEYKKRYQIPVYVWIDGLCASGGMYAAAAADKVYASDVSLIGSVGVIATFFNASETLNKLGIQALTVYRGIGKDAMFSFKPWQAGEDSQIQEIVEYLYGQFVDVVIKGRPRVNREQLIHQYGAKVFPAPQAQSIGFIDGMLTSQSDVVKRLAAEAQLGEDYQVIRLENRSWLQNLFRGQGGLPKVMTHELKLPGIDPRGQMEGFLFLYDPASG